MASKSSFAKLAKILNLMALSLTIVSVSMLIVACSSSNKSASKQKRSYTTTKYYPDKSYSFSENAIISDSVRVRASQGNLATSRAGLSLLEKYSNEESFIVPSSYQNNRAEFRSNKKTQAKKSNSRQAGLTEKILSAAYSQSGAKCAAAGNSPASGFDALGFTRWVYGQNGIRLAGTSQAILENGTTVERDNLRPGDVLIYRHPSKVNEYHVGIYSGAGNFIHAPKVGETITENAAFGPQYERLFVGARRYYNDPKATPLAEQQKSAITSEAIKNALAQRSSRR